MSPVGRTAPVLLTLMMEPPAAIRSPTRADRASAVGAKLRGHLLARFRLAAHDHHVGSGLAERTGDRAAQPAGRAGDNGDPAGEVEQAGHSVRFGMHVTANF